MKIFLFCISKGLVLTTVQSRAAISIIKTYISLPLQRLKGEGDGTHLQHFCRENPMDGGA